MKAWFDWLNANAGAIGIIVTVIIAIFGGLWALITYLHSAKLQRTPNPRPPSSQNDIRVAKEIISLHRGWLRDLLEDHNTWIPIDSSIYTDVERIVYRFDRGEFFFSNEIIGGLNAKFMESLREFYKFMASNTTTEMVGLRSLTGFKPFAHVTDVEYEVRGKLANEANEISSAAWLKLESLVVAIRKEIPEALD